jgi:hypothetical protein
MKKNHNLLFAIGLICIAIITRFLPHPFNFTAVGAIALFSGANFKNRRAAFLIPIAIMMISDIFIGFHVSMIPVYLCFAFTVWMGMIIRNRQNVLPVGLMSILSSVVFFLVTNLPFWYADLSLYPLTLAGTAQSYFMALEFFQNQLAGDLFYNAVLFSAYRVLVRRNQPVTA